jgi:CheY-like chemotaxis protein
VELVVADSGQGIEPDFLPRVFSPFSQADGGSTRTKGGLGLGLAICKDLIELHGGTIHAESAGVGKGATFIVRLPRFAAPPTTTNTDRKIAPQEAASHDVIAGARILLVEDEPQTRAALAKLLSKTGAEVIDVATAAEGMKAFEQTRPDLIISDIGLPQKDGYEFMQRIRSVEMEHEQPATPAIALTAFASAKDRHQARESGFHKHIAKPVTPAALLAAIATLLVEKDRLANGG